MLLVSDAMSTTDYRTSLPPNVVIRDLPHTSLALGAPEVAVWPPPSNTITDVVFTGSGLRMTSTTPRTQLSRYPMSIASWLRVTPWTASKP